MEIGRQIHLDRGALVISIDFELIWGTLDLFGPERFRRACELEREVIIDRLIELFADLNVPATWCVLGHLFLERCELTDGQKHPEIIRPSHGWHKNDWFQHDPCGDEQSAPLFLGHSLIEKIRACSTPQEIGCHSFSHVIFGDAGCSREAAESEVAQCMRLARGLGIELRSFAFPRNSVGHLDVLRDHGFACYRGPEPNWYEKAGLPHVMKRLAHLWDVITAAQPPVVEPERVDAGLWNIPGSMIYFPKHGIRRYIPLSLRVKRAKKGIDAAVRQHRIFHLWFHPTNLADSADEMIDGLRTILEYATSLRDRDELRILPMGSVVAPLQMSAPVPADR
jgi:hypothetical protein